MHCMELYCIVLYCIVLYCTVLSCTVLKGTVLYCTVPKKFFWKLWYSLHQCNPFIYFYFGKEPIMKYLITWIDYNSGKYDTASLCHTIKAKISAWQTVGQRCGLHLLRYMEQLWIKWWQLIDIKILGIGYMGAIQEHETVWLATTKIMSYIRRFWTLFKK